MSKTSCNNLYISSEDVKIYELWKVDLMHYYWAETTFWIFGLNDIPILRKIYKIKKLEPIGLLSEAGLKLEK